jgi:(R,R)-butanediol dehydrogenase/meso-butanediol dehydrogenase/diacetyl reductase
MKAVYYEGAGRFALGPAVAQAPGEGEVRLDVAYCGICGTDLHIAHGAMDQRVKAPQIIGHEMSGTVAELGPGVEGFALGDHVVVRPLDSRGETPADKGISHISRSLKFLGIDTPGAFQSSWTVPAFTLHRLPAGIDLRLAALTEPLAVACHDVRRAAVLVGETAVVIGGGPIGLLVALVAREQGAAVIVSEVNQSRLKLASELGFDTCDPSVGPLSDQINERTGGAGADLVFEVSGSDAGARAMTELAGLRGRVVIVAIFPTTPPVSLFEIVWKELELRGARVYEPQDYDRAIELLAGDVLPLARLVTGVEPLERLASAFAALESSPSAMKILIDCRA